QTAFQFWEFPVMAGVDYRFNLFNAVRPFAIAGPMAMGYWEARNDNVSGSTGFSKCLYLSVGASILLDGLAPSEAWQLYEEHEVKHFYLTVDISKVTTFGSGVDFESTTANVGLGFEF